MSDPELAAPKEPVDYSRVLASRVASDMADGFRLDSQSEFEATLVRRRWFRTQRRVVQVDAFGNVTVVSR